MELATIVIAALIIIVLQIVTISLVLSNRSKKVVQSVPSGRGTPNRSDPRKDSRNQQRKPPQQNRQKSERASVSPTDKSLRDINLRLKSAERDQEKARKDIRSNTSNSDEGGSGDDRGNRKRDDRRGRNNRSGRRRSGSNGNRDRSNRSSENRNYDKTSSPQDAEKKSPAPEEKVSSQAPSAAKPVESQAAPQNQSNAESEDMQHGRKVVVKRRVLGENESTNNEPGIGSVSDSNSTREDTSSETSQKVESFGRR